VKTIVASQRLRPRLFLIGTS